MFGISTKKGGTCGTPGPLDVYIAQMPAPTPMPSMNTAQCSRADPGTCTQRVRIGSHAVLTKNSVIPMSSGRGPGVASGMTMGPCSYRRFSSRVKFDGVPVVHHLCATGHNGSSPNALGQQNSPSQPKV